MGILAYFHKPRLFCQFIGFFVYNPLQRFGYAHYDAVHRISPYDNFMFFIGYYMILSTGFS
jgi:hypothetical protein